MQLFVMLCLIGFKAVYRSVRPRPAARFSELSFHMPGSVHARAKEKSCLFFSMMSADSQTGSAAESISNKRNVS